MEEREKHHSPRRWGTVIKRTNADGQVTAYVARYVNPINKKKKSGSNSNPNSWRRRTPGSMKSIAS